MAPRKPKTHPENTVAVERRPRWATPAMALTLVVVTFAAHSPAIWAGYIWDDDVCLYKNPLVAAPEGLYKFWFTTEEPTYWPMTATVFWIQWRVWGDNPMPYHIMNIVLHCISAMLLWRVLLRLNLGAFGSFLGATLFAVHPVTVESVAWISELKNTLSVMFSILALWAYLRFEDENARRWYVLALPAAFAGMLAKSSVVMLPIILLIYVWWRRWRLNRRDFLLTMPFFAIALTQGMMTLWTHHQNALVDAVVRPEGPASRIACVGWVFWFYLYKIFSPVDLMMVYPRWDVDGGRVLSFIPLALMIACFLVLWYYRKSWGRGPLAAMGSYVIVLAPVLGLLTMAYANHSLVADHLQYPAMPAVLALIGSGLAALYNWAQRKNTRGLAPGIATLIGIIVVVLAVLTWRQAHIYKDSISLWTHNISLNNSSWTAYLDRGNAYNARGMLDLAIRDYTKTIEVKPDCAVAYNNRGIAYGNMLNYDQQLLDCTKAIEIKPTYAEAFSNRGNAYNEKGSLDLAIRDYTKAIELKPDYAGAYNNRSVVYSKKQDYNLAIRDLTKVIELEPNNTEALNSRGVAYSNQHDYDHAIQDFTKAIKLDPFFAAVYSNRGLAYGGKKVYDQAIRDCSKAIELTPNYAHAYYIRGLAYGQMNDHARASQDFTRTIELNANHGQAYESRSIAFVFLKQYDKAWADVKKCRQLGMAIDPALLDRLHNETGRTE